METDSEFPEVGLVLGFRAPLLLWLSLTNVKKLNKLLSNCIRSVSNSSGFCTRLIWKPAKLRPMLIKVLADFSVAGSSGKEWQLLLCEMFPK